MLRAKHLRFFLLASCSACTLEVPNFMPEAPIGSDGGPISAPGPPPKIAAFEVLPSALPPGAKAHLSWSTENADAISIRAMPGGSLLDRSPMTSGELDSAELSEATTFELTAAGPNGASQAVRLVTIDPTALAIIELSAFPDPAARDSNTELRWRTNGAASLLLKRGNTVLLEATPEELARGTLLSPRLAQASTTFMLEISDGVDTKIATITVAADLPPTIDAFTATPSTFTTTSAAVELSFSAQNARAVRLLENGREIEALGPAGMITRTVDRTTIFDLVAESGGGMITRHVYAAQLDDPEIEPNDAFGSATRLRNGAAQGLISDENDEDVYAVGVGSNANFFATVANPDGTCAFASVLELADPDGDPFFDISRRNSSVPSDCPEIDPRMIGDPLISVPLGLYYLSVRSLDHSGPYTLVVAATEPRCGDGIIEFGEQCDDWNHANGDNCSDSCRIEAETVFGAEGGETIVNLTKYDPATPSYYRWIRIELPTAGKSIEIRTSDRDSADCSLDTALEIFDERGQLDRQPEDADTHGCAAIAFPGAGRTVGLPGGSYRVLVLNRDPARTAPTRVTVTIHDPACGNAALEPGEQCDDGNTTSGDGCDARCALEPVQEIVGPPSINTFSGTLTTLEQRDAHLIALNAPGYIVARTFTPSTPRCDSPFDTVLTLKDANFEVRSENDDYHGSLCAELELTWRDRLEAGHYRLEVSTAARHLPTPYEVRVETVGLVCGNGVADPPAGETCDDGNTTSGDGCSASCQYEGVPIGEGEINDSPADALPVSISSGMPVLITGSLSSSDADYFEVALSGPYTLHARTHAVMGNPDQCDSNIDTELALYEPNNSAYVVFNDDIDPHDPCSEIAADLAAGTYYLEVFPFRDPVPEYFLTIEID